MIHHLLWGFSSSAYVLFWEPVYKLSLASISLCPGLFTCLSADKDSHCLAHHTIFCVWHVVWVLKMCWTNKWTCHPIFIAFFFFIDLFIFGCVGSSLLRTGFLQLQWAGATLRCGARTSHCGGFSCCGARALGVWASVVVARGLQSAGLAVVAHGPSCSAACGILPGQGWTRVPCLGRRILNHCATREALEPSWPARALASHV